MEASTSYHQISYSKPVQESHLDLLNRGTLSDVTFIVGPTKERIPCHQAFLVARSPVFEVMFSERWNQVKNPEILIENVDPKIFKKFLQFIYADTIVADVPEALDLLQVADKYGVQLLFSRCEELLLASDVPINHAGDVFQAGRKYQKVQLIDKAVDSMAKSLSELRIHLSFSRVDKEILMCVLKRDYLELKEVDLFCLAVQWAKDQSDMTLEQSLEDILPLIRFPTMTLEELTRTVVPTGLLPQSTLVEIFTYLGADAETKKSMASTLKFNTRRRLKHGSMHYFDLYSEYLARTETRRLWVQKLEDYLEISTRITGTTAVGIDGICVYCPATAGTVPASSTFKEFTVVLEQEIRRIQGIPSYKNLLTMSPVKAEEGKMMEIKFHTLIPLQNNVHYRIAVEEIQPASMAVSCEGYHTDAKVFGRIRNLAHILDVINHSVVIEIGSKRTNEPPEVSGKDLYPQMICRLSLEVFKEWPM